MTNQYNTEQFTIRGSDIITAIPGKISQCRSATAASAATVPWRGHAVAGLVPVGATAVQGLVVYSQVAAVLPAVVATAACMGMYVLFLSIIIFIRSLNALWYYLMRA